MMKILTQPTKRYLYVALLIITPMLSVAQQYNFEAVFDTISLNDQFDYLYKRSNTYEDYKVMKIQGYRMVQKNSLDSIQHYKDQIISLKENINQLDNDLNVSKSEVDNLNEKLSATENTKNSMSFIGIEIPKGTYNLIMWGMLLVVGAAAVILFLLYQRGHHVVKETKARLQEVQEDFEAHRKNALTREQKLARELMDVKLKYKGR